MNPPAKKALGRSIGDTVLAGLALLLVRYFGPEPEKAPKAINTDGIMKYVTLEHRITREHIGINTDRIIFWIHMGIIITGAVMAFLLAVSLYPSKTAPNFNAMPPPIETPVVLFTRSGHWHKAVRDSLGVDRNYETWERINNAIGWMKP